MKYSENKWVGNQYRQEYLDGIHKFIRKRREVTNKERAEFAEAILDNISQRAKGVEKRLRKIDQYLDILCNY